MLRLASLSLLWTAQKCGQGKTKDDKMATPKLPMTFAIAGAVLAFAFPASAAVRTTVVSVADLDLTRPSAQQQLEDRIDRAVRKVCRGHVALNMAEQRDVTKCKADARAGAEAQMTQRIAEHKAGRKNAAKARLKLASD
jgi:UrcA family protein